MGRKRVLSEFSAVLSSRCEHETYAMGPSSR
jgi:hypothetical protein